MSAEGYKVCEAAYISGAEGYLVRPATATTYEVAAELGRSLDRASVPACEKKLAASHKDEVRAGYNQK